MKIRSIPKLFIVLFLIFLLFGTSLHANVSASKKWKFNEPENYRFDTEQVEVKSGEARLRVDWFDTDWSYRQQITINSSKVSGSVSDFPVYLNLNDMNPNFFSEVQSDGDDILITRSDGESTVPHEIVKINTSSDSGEAWFQAPKLSSSSDTSFYIYYGNPSASNQEDTASLWDSSNYEAVWHLEENSGGAEDATNNNHDATNNGATQGVDAKLSEGYEFEDPNDWLKLSSFPDKTSNFTISAWIKTDDQTKAGQRIFTDDDNNSGGYSCSLGDPGSGEIRFYSRSATQTSLDTTNGPISTNKWHYVHCIADISGSDRFIWVDKSLEPDDGSNVGWGGTDSGNTSIGGETNNGETGNRFDGKLDEVRIYNRVVSSDWIITSYNNQDTPSSFYSIGGEESDSRNDTGVISNKNGPTFESLDTFVETPGNNHTGTLAYQITNDTTTWYYHDGANWSPASDSSQTNSASEVDNNLPTFDNDIGTGTFFFRAFLLSDSTTTASLDEIELGYFTRSNTQGRTPASFPNSNACWSNVERVQTSADTYSTADANISNPCGPQEFSGFGFNIPSTEKIKTVEVGVEHYSPQDNVRPDPIEVSADSGSMFSNLGQFNSNDTDDDNVQWKNATGVEPWTPETINDSLVVAVTGDFISGPSFDRRLEVDYLAVRVEAVQPTISIDNPSDGTDTNVSPITVSGTSSKTNLGDSVVLKVNGQVRDTVDVQAGGDWSGTGALVGLKPDTVTAELRRDTPVEDVLDSDSIQVNYDTIPPQIQIDTPEANTETNVLTLDVSGTVTRDAQSGDSVWVWSEQVGGTISTTIQSDSSWLRSGVALARDDTNVIRSLIVDTYTNRSIDTVPVLVDITKPDTVDLNNPSNGTETNTKSIDFSWTTGNDTLSGIRNYRIQVDTGTTPTSSDGFVIEGDTNTTDTTFTLDRDDSYVWRVFLRDVAGNTSGFSKLDTFIVDRTGPVDTFDPRSPETKTNTNVKQINFDWNDVSDTLAGLNRYYIQVARDTQFNRIVFDSSTLSSDTTFTLSGDTEYFWRLKAVDDAGNTTGFSRTDTFAVDRTAPSDMFDLITPTNGASTRAQSVVFDWQEAIDTFVGIRNYQIQVATDTLFNNIVSDSISITSDTDITLPSETTYYWRVYARDEASNTSGFTNTDTFLVDRGDPVKPSLLSPGDGSETTAGIINFSWTDISSTSADVDNYRLQVDTGSTVDESNGIFFEGDTFSTDTPLQVGEGSFAWRVFSRDNAGNTSGYTNSDTFFVDRTGPPDPSLLEPIDGVGTNTVTIQFDWTDVTDTLSGFSNYHFEIDSGTIVQGDVVFTGDTTTSDTRLTLPDDTYVWRVFARDNLGNTSDFSPSDTFILDTLKPTTPILQTPVDGSATSSISTTFDWTNAIDTGAAVRDYFVEVARDSSFTSVVKAGFTGGSTSDTQFSLSGDTQYWWRVFTRDNANNTSGFTPADTFLVDRTAPFDTFVSPLDGDTVNRTLTLMVEANDTFSGLDRVRFWIGGVGGTLIGTATTSDSNGLWSVPVDSNIVPDGSYTVTAQALDKAGVFGTDQVNVLVDNTKPNNVQITSHSDGDVVEDTITITATASDPSGGVMDRVEFYQGLFPNPVGVGDAIEVEFNESFVGTPRVVAMIEDSNNDEVLAQVTDVTGSSFDLYLCGEGDNNNNCGEGDNRYDSPPFKVSWVAIDDGANPFSNSDVGQTSMGSSQWTYQSFTGIGDTPAVVSSIVTNNGGQQQKPTMSRFVTPSGMQIRFCEHDATNSCDGHSGENVDWFAFEPGLLSGAGSGVGEAGIARVPADSAWRNIRLSQDYDNPVVLANNSTDNGGSSENGGNSGQQPKVAQVREVNFEGRNFELRVCEHHNDSQCDPNGLPAQKVGYAVFDLADVESISGLDGGVLNLLNVDTTSASWTATLNTNKIPDGNRDFHVEAYDRAGNQTRLLDPVTLKIDRSPPSDTFDLLSPYDGEETNTTNPVTFDWEDASDTVTTVTDYYIEVSDDPSFASVNRSGTTTSSDTTFTLSGDTVYYWRVTAFDTLNNAQVIGPDSFVVDRTKPVVDTPTLTVTDDVRTLGVADLNADTFLGNNIRHQFTVHVTEPFTTDEVTLFLRNDGSLPGSSDTSFTMREKPSGSDTWLANVPDTYFDVGDTINFKITAVDSATNKRVEDSGSVGFRYKIMDTVANRPPAVRFTSPEAGDTFGRTVSGTYVISDSQDIEATVDVEYSTDSGASWSEATMVSGVDSVPVTLSGDSTNFVWDSQTDLGVFYDTDVKLRARAYDGEETGAFDTSPAFTVDQVPPSNASFFHPSPSEFVEDITTLIASVEDTGSGDVNRVEFFRGTFPGGTSIGADTDSSDSWATPWNTNSLSDGNRDLYYVARDEFGNTTTASVTAIIDNSEPGPLSIGGINDGDSISGVVTSTVNVSDNGPSGMERVEFHRDVFRDTVLIEFKESFSNPPIVLADIQDNNGREINEQILEITQDTALLSVCGTAGCGRYNTSQKIGWIALESGKYPFSFGRSESQIESNLTSNNSVNVSFGVNFDETPITASSLQTNNEIDQPKPPEEGSISSNSMDLLFCLYTGGDGCAGSSAPEDVGWLAIEPGFFGPDIGIAGSRILGGNTWSTINITRNLDDPLVLVGHNDFNGGQQARTAQARRVGPSQFDVRQCEYEDDTGCDGHASNPIGWMAFDLAEVRTASGMDGGITSFLSEDDVAPFNLNWDTRRDTEGRRNFTVKAFDKAGNVDSKVITVTVDNTEPGTVALQSPTNGIIAGGTTVNFDWTDAPDTLAGVRDYFIQVAEDPGFNTVVKSGFTTTNTSDTNYQFSNDRTHFWRVFSRDNAGNTSGYSVSDSFVYDGTPPADTFSLLQPADGTDTNVGTIKFEWQDTFDTLSGFRDFNIEIAEDSSFSASSIVFDSFTITTDTQFNLPADTEYFWRVTARDQVGNRSTTSVDTFIVDRDIPKPVQQDPSEQSDTRFNPVPFNWSTINDSPARTKRYKFQVARDTNFSTQLKEGFVNQSDTQVTLGADTVFHWRVYAENTASETSGYTGTDTFLLDRTRPETFTLQAPQPGTETNSITLNFDWTNSADTLSGLDFYKLQVDTGATVTDTDGITIQGNPINSDTTITFETNSLYSWRVLSRDNASNTSGYTPSDTFIVDTNVEVPDLFVPESGGATRANPVPFDWEGISDTLAGIEDYKLQVSYDSAFSNLRIDSFTQNSDTEVSLSGDTVYYWRVYARDGAGNTSGFSLRDTFIVDRRSPDTVSLLSPDSGEDTNAGNPVPFDWSTSTDTSSGIRDYRIQISYDSTFESSNLATDSFTSTSDTTLTLSGDTRYHWRVSARDNVLNTSGFTPADTFILDRSSPDTPELTTPNSGEDTRLQPVVMDWIDSGDNFSGLKNYRLQISTDTNFPSANTVLDSTVTGSDTIIRLDGDTVYYWKVFSRDEATNTSGYSPTDTFIVDRTGPPDTFELKSPEDQENTSSQPVKFNWEDAMDTLAGIDDYRIQISRDTAFVSSSVIVDSRTSKSDTEFVLAGDTDYYWRVSARDDAGNTSGFVGIDTFVVDRSGPSIPNLTRPASGTDTNALAVPFEWSMSADPTSKIQDYRIQVATDTSFQFSDLVIDSFVLSSDTEIELESDTKYFWRVLSRDNALNTSGFSSKDTFIVDRTAPANTFSLITPVDGSPTRAQPVPFDWSSSGDTLTGVAEYQFQVATDTPIQSSNLVADSVTSVSDTTLKLNGDTVFFWRVFARDEATNTSGFVPADSFIVDRTVPSDTFELRNPTSGIDTNSETINFEWESAFDTFSGLNDYRIELSTDTVFSSSGIVADSVTTDTTIPIEPGSDTIYFWRVFASDNAANTSQSSSVDTFTIDRSSPPKPALLEPEDQSATRSQPIPFDWTDTGDDLSGLKNFQIQLSTDTSFGSSSIVADSVSTTSDTEFVLTNDTTYKWRLFSRDNATNTSGFSDIDTFIVDRTDPYDTFVPVAPSDSEISRRDINFDWTDSGDTLAGLRRYRIQVGPDSTFPSSFDKDSYVTESMANFDVKVDTDVVLRWRVRAEDNAGNTSAFIVADTFLKRALRGGEIEADTLILSDTVSQGQKNTSVVLNFRNTGDTDVREIDTPTLRFISGGTDVGDSYTVTLKETSSNYPIDELPKNETVRSTFSVDVDREADTGSVSVLAPIQGKTFTDTTVRDTGTASWLVEEPAEVRVNSIRTESDSYVLEDGPGTSVQDDTYTVVVEIENYGVAKAKIRPDTLDLTIVNQLNDTVSELFAENLETDPDTQFILDEGETRLITYEGPLPDRDNFTVLGRDTTILRTNRPISLDTNSGENVIADADGEAEIDTFYRSVSGTESFVLKSPDERFTARVPANKYDTKTEFTAVIEPKNNCVKQANKEVSSFDDINSRPSLRNTITRIISTREPRGSARNEKIPITLNYDESGIEDETELKNFVLNESECSWDPVQPPAKQVNAPDSNTVTARTDGFSFFRVLIVVTTEDNISDLMVGPNPYRPNDGNPQTGLPTDGSARSGIRFENLTPQVEIRIYTIHGSLVAKLESSDTRGDLRWDVTNREGTPVASGVYLYVVENPETGETKTGKLAIIR